MLHICIESLHLGIARLQKGMSWFWVYCVLHFYWSSSQFVEWCFYMGSWIQFQGTINMDDPFSNEPIHADGSVEEIVDAQWYKKTNVQCKQLCPNEPCLILPVVEYIDKTGTNVNQRNKLEPFSFTLGLLNHSWLPFKSMACSWFHAWFRT